MAHSRSDSADFADGPHAGAPAPSPPLRAIEVGKRYGATLALTRATLELRHGEVLGLVGQNGSGKSTLLRILGGIEHPDAGMVLWGERPAPVGGLSEGVRRGVVLVFQELALLENLRAFESFFVPAPALAYHWGVQRGRWMRACCREACARHGLALDPEQRVGELAFGTRQLLEVIRALELPRLLGVQHPTVLLDEPTSALDHHEVERLRLLMERNRGSASFVFVSHRLGEVLGLCDRVIVMSEGQTIAEHAVPGLREQELHELILAGGQPRAVSRGPRARAAGGQARLELLDATASGFHEVTLRVRQGEIVGLAGVEGSGKSELCEAVYGLRRLSAGHLRLAEREHRRVRPRAQVNHNLAYLPKERTAGGIIGSASVARHVGLHMMRSRLFTDPPLERDLSRAMMDRFEISPPDPDMLVSRLSGGNQQKVALGKWMVDLPELFVLDNPTRGVDVQARGVIHREILKVASRGSSVLMAGDELDELLALCDTIHVMRDGAIAHTLDVRSLPSGVQQAEQVLLGHML